MSQEKQKDIEKGSKLLSKGVKQKRAKRPGKQNARRLSADEKLAKLAANAEPGKEYTLEEIASVMGITRERVRQIEQKALMRLYPKIKKILSSDGVSADQLYSVLRRGKDQTFEYETSDT